MARNLLIILPGLVFAGLTAVLLLIHDSEKPKRAYYTPANPASSPLILKISSPTESTLSSTASNASASDKSGLLDLWTWLSIKEPEKPDNVARAAKSSRGKKYVRNIHGMPLIGYNGTYIAAGFTPEIWRLSAVIPENCNTTNYSWPYSPFDKILYQNNDIIIEENK